jgi:steroid 5-alpha reductase family enzyme
MLCLRSAISLAVLLGCTIWSAPRRTYPRIHVRLYFGTRFVVCLGCTLVELGPGFHSQAYRIAFVLGTLTMAWPMASLAWDCRPRTWTRCEDGIYREWFYRRPGRAWLLGLAVAAFLALRIVLSRERYDWIGVLEGFITLLVAVPAAVGAMAGEGQPAAIATVLTFLWLVEATFELGYTLHPLGPQWQALNDWVPMAVTSVGCLALAREATCPDLAV